MQPQKAGTQRQNASNSYAEVEETVWLYFECARRADEVALRDVLDPVWNAKRLSDRSGTVVVETRNEFVTRILARGPDSNPADKLHLTSIQVYFDDFAIARVDDWSLASATILILFKARGAWRIAGEAGLAAGDGTRQASFNPRTAESQVLHVLDEYYRAVEAGNPDPIRRIFDAGWHMKNHEGDVLVSEDKAAFIDRIEGGPLAGYVADRQIADVQVLYDRMAYVCVHKPSGPVATVFIFFRTQDGWMILEKAFSSDEK